MGERPPLGAISIGSNDMHLLVATSDGIGTFERNANQSMLAELVGAVRGGVVPAKALSQALLASIPKATYLCLLAPGHSPLLGWFHRPQAFSGQRHCARGMPGLCKHTHPLPTSWQAKVPISCIPQNSYPNDTPKMDTD